MIDKFIKEYGEDLFDRMMANVYGDIKDDDVTVNIETSDREGLNISGEIYIRNKDLDIIVEFADGNFAGTQIFDYY